MACSRVWPPFSKPASNSPVRAEITCGTHTRTQTCTRMHTQMHRCTDITRKHMHTQMGTHVQTHADSSTRAPMQRREKESQQG
eukprot:2898637-Rhodomonas_salina.1